MSVSRRTALAVFLSSALLVPAAGFVGPAMAQAISVRGLGPTTVQTERVRVVSVDRGTRNVVVERGGRQWRITVPAAFGSLAALRRRDRLDINRVESAIVAVTRATPGARPDVVLTETANNGTFDNLPARWVVRSVTVTAEFTRLDGGVVHYVGPEGPRTMRVVDPTVISALSTLRRGDMINLVFTEATQIVLTPRRL
ncbi:conserved exported hypothetical protein [Hyphomicrobiales bacterium]|nr:conserved exported hypothetical protein [Hyphomicrobiales bacterium]CAH1663303.1 conserved exported hypothetical protein [Hyphomicrobiales bacterium]